MVEKHEKAVKRFGVRYGRTVKKRLGRIEALQKRKHQCPFCHYRKVSRLAVGIWHCAKCNATFASKAYTVTTPERVKEERVEV